MSHRVVTRDIPIGDPGRGVFAFRVGDMVDERDVKANKWEDYVASPSTKAGQQAVAEASGEQPTAVETPAQGGSRRAARGGS